jgi:putative membrane protein
MSAFGWILFGVAILAVVALFGAAAFGGYAYAPMMPMPYYGYHFFGGWFFFPFGLLFFLFFVFFIGRWIFWPWGRGWRHGYWYNYGDAREILRQRYAKGEITKDQFEQMMRDLEQHQ